MKILITVQDLQAVGKTHEEHMERTFVRFSSAMRHNSFRLACGHGSRTAFRCDAFAERVDGIPLACRIGSAIDGGESLRKSASLVNFGGVVFVPTSKFLLLIPLWTCWCKKIDVGRGVQGLRKNNGFSDLAHGLLLLPPRGSTKHLKASESLRGLVLY